MYLPSIDVQEYNPPHYQIAGHFIHVSGMPGRKETDIYITLRYNFYTKETFSRDEYGNWKKRDVTNDSFAVRRYRQIADALFRAAYNMDFYGY